MRRWGLVDASGKVEGKSYKASDEARGNILDALELQAPWLQISSEQRDFLVSSDHLLDALISALTARAAWWIASRSRCRTWPE